MSEFEKIIGYEEIKKELVRFCDVLKYPEKYAKLGVTMPSGILLYGEPGVGKTLMTKCFIDESGCKAFTLRKEKPNGDFVNEIKGIFEKAKAEAPAIVVLDDMDKFANEDDEHPNAEEYVTVQACIDDCKGCGVFVLATANDTSNLPNSLMRAGRFDRVLRVDSPRGSESHKIISHFMQSINAVDNIDFEAISRILEGYTCAEIETIINEAGIYAGFENRQKVGEEDIIRALVRKCMGYPEGVKETSPDVIKKVAVHEAGHAVVADILCPGCVTLISVEGSSIGTGGGY